MTCIVGLEAEHGTWLGTDAFTGNEGWRGVIDPKRKIVDLCVGIGDYMAVGLCGSWALREVLLTAERPDVVKGDPEGTLFRYTTAWRERAAALGFNSTDNGQTETPNKGGGAALIAYRGRLWYLTGEWVVVKTAAFIAIGSGGSYAEGALAATEGILPAEERVKAALTAAADLCPTVSRPFFTHWQAVP